MDSNFYYIISIIGILNILLNPYHLNKTIEPHLFSAVIVGTYLRIILIGAQLHVFSRHNVRLYFKETGDTTIF